MNDLLKYVSKVNAIIEKIEKERLTINGYDEIITKDEINDILKKYNISKTNLSRLLGFGELTITRYLNGATPTLQKSKFLKEILYSPNYYFIILLCNKHKITYNAFFKSQVATFNLI